MKDILICSNLCKKINGKNVLRNLDFTLKEREFAIIEGISGKTVLLKLMAGIDFPESGSLFLDLVPIGQETKSQTAALMQENTVFSKLDISGSMDLYLRLYDGFDAVEACKLIKILDIDKFSKFSELSYTQFKMSEFIFTVCRSVKVYLFDEPSFVLLDKKYREIFVYCLENIRKSGRAVVLFTRNADVYNSLFSFDRTVFLRNGRIFGDSFCGVIK